MMIASANAVVVSTNKRKKPLKTANGPPVTLKYCDKCDFNSDDMNEFSEHMKFEHNMDEIYPCDLCSFYTQSLWDYQVHMEKAHQDQKMSESDNENDIVDEQLVEHDESCDDEDDDNEHKQSILYSSSSSSSSSISIDPKKINSDQEQNRNSLIFNNKNQVNDKMLYDLANQYSNPNQLNQLIQKYNQHLSSQQVSSSSSSSIGSLPRFNHQIQNVAPNNHHANHHNNTNHHHSHNHNHEKTKRHYNSEVDPARYRKVLEDGITKFACSICGNTYKWRKSLNKHWKEKHLTETPPPLDAPVAVKLRNGNTTLNCSNSGQNLSNQKPKCSESTSLPASASNQFNAMNLFQQYLSSMSKGEVVKTQGGGEDGSAPLDLSMKPKRERSRSPSASQRSNSASSTSSSSNSSSSATSSESSSAESTTCPPHHQQQTNDATMGLTKTNADKSAASNLACSNGLNNSAASQSSSSQVYNQKLFICSVCDAKFHVVDQINEHFLKNHYNEYQRELSSKSPPRNTNVAQQNEEWNLSDPQNPLKCIKCDFVGRWPTELQKHAASHSTSRPFKCLICSLTYKWRWDLAKHFDRTHPTFRNPYKKRDRDAARSTLINPMQTQHTAPTQAQGRKSRSRSRSNESSLDEHKKLKYEQICINPNTPPLSSSSSSSSSSTCSTLQTSLLPPFLSPQSQNTAAMYAAYLLANPALLANPLFAMAALQNVHSSPQPPLAPPMAPLSLSSSSCSSLSSSSHNKMSAKAAEDEPETRVRASPSSSSLSKRIKLDGSGGAESADEKETRNFQCFWCDFRGRWRSEIIQHMRCHHAREKPYRCSSCMYASNWKWDVQKHTKKQHPNATAKIVEIPDQVLFPDLKELNFFESIKPINGAESPRKSAVSLTPPSSSSSSTSSILSSSSIRSHKKASTSLNCHQCPYVACNLSDLRRHLIVHSNEQPYHCCVCVFKSKWKSDVKKHQRSSGHIGPILVGKKAMQKVIETLGLDKRSQLPNIELIDNRQCKSNEKLVDEEDMVVAHEDADHDHDPVAAAVHDDSDEELYEQLNEDEEYFDDDEDDIQHTGEQHNFEQEFVNDNHSAAELEIDHDDDNLNHDDDNDDEQY